jgi:hypothetical protein
MTIRTRNYTAIRPVVRMVVTAILSAGPLAADSTLAIASPADGSTARPGTNLPVTVTPTGSFTEVVVVGEGAIGFSRVLTAPPYQFSLAIPAGISPGRYALTALGVASGSVASVPITISVERADAPVQFDVTPSTLSLSVGQRVPLRVIGTYADGAKLDITSSAGTTFSSTSPGVASVDSQGSVSGVAPGSARIMVNNFLAIPVVVPASLAVTPQYPVLYGSQSATFSAYRPGKGNVPVRWTVSPAIGSVNAAGVYTAPPQIPSQQLVMITASSTTDSNSVATGIALFPPVSLTVSPVGPVALKAGQGWRFAQTVLNALDSGVDWSISPLNSGTIDATGLYTAPSAVASQQTVVITATSLADRTKTASATVTLQP